MISFIYIVQSNRLLSPFAFIAVKIVSNSKKKNRAKKTGGYFHLMVFEEIGIDSNTTNNNIKWALRSFLFIKTTKILYKNKRD